MESAIPFHVKPRLMYLHRQSCIKCQCKHENTKLWCDTHTHTQGGQRNGKDSGAHSTSVNIPTKFMFELFLYSKLLSIGPEHQHTHEIKINIQIRNIVLNCAQSIQKLHETMLKGDGRQIMKIILKTKGYSLPCQKNEY